MTVKRIQIMDSPGSSEFRDAVAINLSEVERGLFSPGRKMKPGIKERRPLRGTAGGASPNDSGVFPGPAGRRGQPE